MIDVMVANAEARIDVAYQDFQQIKQQARIPVMNDVAADVIDALQRRVGRQSLSISDVAEDINLSKRTLQRRLQQQMISYASLRDKVRFNHAIDCLLTRNMSIEKTSSYLDFSDRTSFTNAFKRWTQLSPSAFRKLYRDYI